MNFSNSLNPVKKLKAAPVFKTYLILKKAKLNIVVFIG